MHCAEEVYVVKRNDDPGPLRGVYVCRQCKAMFLRSLHLVGIGVTVAGVVFVEEYNQFAGVFLVGDGGWEVRPCS